MYGVPLLAVQFGLLAGIRAVGGGDRLVFERIIAFSLRHPVLVMATVLAGAAFGLAALPYLDIDAFPDTTPVQVQINTPAPALAAEEVEQQITFPIEQVMGGLPRLEKLRSVSKFGLSQVVLTFEDGTDIYWARQLVNERLAVVELPPGVERPRLGPVSTGLGEVLHYIVTLKDVDISRLTPQQRQEWLTYLRTVHDWVIKPQLRSVKGVVEINSWGGYEKQYEIRVAPQRLAKYSLTFHDVVQAIERNHRNVGGGIVRRGQEMLLVHGMGRATRIEDFQHIVVTADQGIPIRIADVADVTVGHALRHGAVTANGQGEVVLGLGFMLMGESAHRVTRRLIQRLEDIRASLPPHVQIQIVYDRTELVDQVLETVRKNLYEGAILVIAVLFALIGNFRAALIVALVIPLAMLFAFSGMLYFGIAASLLSLGAIDFGLLVDSSIVQVENCVRYLSKNGAVRQNKRELICKAANEVRSATVYGELIIMVVYVPILALVGIEGKLFRPMAITVLLALGAALVLSITWVPVLTSLIIPAHVTDRLPILMRLAHAVHNPMLRFCMKQKAVIVGLALIVLVFSFGFVAPHLGAEFVPRLSEGALAINVVRLAGTDLEESIRYNTQMEKLILENFPDEVRHVWSRIGTAETATDPMGVELTDIFVSLTPRHRWKKARTQEELAELIKKQLRQMPGQRLVFSQPIELRLNEMTSGVRSDLGVKVFGDDFQLLTAKAQQIERILRSLPGSADVTVEQWTGQPVLEIKLKQEEIARYGLSASTVLDVVESLSGKPLGDVVEGQLRFPVVVRLPEVFRTEPERFAFMVITTPSGEEIPLGRLTEIRFVRGMATIIREWGQRRITVSCNVRGRDVVSFVEEARQKISQSVVLPPGRYRIEYGGQFEHYQAARQRLMIVTPIAIGLILCLLFLTYRNVLDALRVLTGVPLGWVGGILALAVRQMPFSISAAIGFIAMSGVAVLDDMMLVSYIRQLRRQGMAADEAVRVAAVTRLRPALMTTLVATLGLVPMALSTGVGAEVQRPLATVVIGGVISAMIMSLLVIRVLYIIFDGVAVGIVWLATTLLGIRAEQLQWLVGDYRQISHFTHVKEDHNPSEQNNLREETMTI